MKQKPRLNTNILMRDKKKNNNKYQKIFYSLKNYFSVHLAAFQF